MTGPVICNQVSPELTGPLAAHPSKPKVIECFDTRTPWNIPAEAEILVTRFFEAWPTAPKVAPDLPRLRFVQTFSAGVEAYPDWLLRDRLVSCGRGLTSDQIAEYVMAAIMRVEKDIESFRVSKASDWRSRPMGRLSGRRLGLLGFGAIGQAIMRRAQAFDMVVSAVRRSAWADTPPGLQACSSAEELFASCDHLVLAMPVTAQTRGMVNRELLSCAKPGLHLINISRGALLDQEALIAALDAGEISSATLDVMTPEPPPEGHPLLGRPDVFVTPHISYAGGISELDKFCARILANLDAYIEGRPLAEQVDFQRGY
ncbi:NAD(P)-dependent oxidoreductase [Neorhizobium sp. NCHU2750]|uniref:NAD(P)-dependent oxidoreductase n=1 Tax=Neorhizobium sp. NCHU2750 TaxID=1825976 RepID=UPI000E747DEF|nr:hypothetical protein NCHU2750_54540 [Neorhizobium sp. NCHU2750]